MNFENQGIIPDLIDRAPAKLIEVTYNSKKVDSGNKLTPYEVKEQPAVIWEIENDTYYTLMLLDPDAPSKRFPVLGAVNHWLVTNILGNELLSGDEIVAYRGSGPPKYTGLHRYVFLVYKQPEKLVFNESITSASSLLPRLRFNIRKFTKKYNLEDPVAGNFFTAEWCPNN